MHDTSGGGTTELCEREKASACDKDRATSVPLTLVMHSCCLLAPDSRRTGREKVARSSCARERGSARDKDGDRRSVREKEVACATGTEI